MKNKLILTLGMGLALAPIGSPIWCGACDQLWVCAEVLQYSGTWEHWCSIEEASPEQRCFDQEKRWAQCVSLGYGYDTRTSAWQYSYTCDSVNVYCY